LAEEGIQYAAQLSNPNSKFAKNNQATDLLHIYSIQHPYFYTM
jgi:hypothetical protein